MKKALAFFAFIVLLVVFVGCDNTPPHEDEHVWDDGVVTKEATCSELGEKTFNCSHCGVKKVDRIEKNPENHIFSYEESFFNPIAIERCKGCGLETGNTKPGSIRSLDGYWMSDQFDYTDDGEPVKMHVNIFVKGFECKLEMQYEEIVSNTLEGPFRVETRTSLEDKEYSVVIADIGYSHGSTTWSYRIVGEGSERMGCCFLRSRNIQGCLMHGRMRMGTSMNQVIDSILLVIVFWLQYLGRMKAAIIIGLKKCPILQPVQSKATNYMCVQSVEKEKLKSCLLIQMPIGTSDTIIRKKQSSLPQLMFKNGAWIADWYWE